MGLIAGRTSIAQRPHWIALSGPDGPPTPDGDGDYTQAMAALDPAGAWAEIRTADATDQERARAQTTVLTMVSHVITLPYHPQVTTGTEILFGTRRFAVVGVSTPEERQADTIANCIEVVP